MPSTCCATRRRTCISSSSGREATRGHWNDLAVRWHSTTIESGSPPVRPIALRHCPRHGGVCDRPGRGHRRSARGHGGREAGRWLAHAQIWPRSSRTRRPACWPPSGIGQRWRRRCGRSWRMRITATGSARRGEPATRTVRLAPDGRAIRPPLPEVVDRLAPARTPRQGTLSITLFPPPGPSCRMATLLESRGSSCGAS